MRIGGRQPVKLRPQPVKLETTGKFKARTGKKRDASADFVCFDMRMLEKFRRKK